MKSSIKILNILVLSVALFFCACSEEKNQEAIQKKQTPQALAVNTITIKNTNIPIWIEYTGKTKASSSQEVRARVAGILEDIYYKDGQNVKKGQKLFKIEQTDYIANLNRAKARKKRHEAKLKLAQADVNRYKPLVKEGLAPRVTLEQYEAQVETILADIDSDNSEIKQAELELSYTIIKAPIDGQASRRLVDIGNLVGKSESTVLTTINKNNPLYAYFSPTEEDFQKINQYKDNDILQAYITFNYQSKMLKKYSKFGIVNFSDNRVDPNTSTISMRAEIPNADNSIFSGTFVYVNIYITNRFKLSGIPPEVIFEDQMGKFVYVVDKNNKAQKKYVKPIFESRFFTLLDKDNLKDGDRVIVNALLRLKPDLKVKATDMTSTLGVDAIIKEHNLIPKSPKKTK